MEFIKYLMAGIFVLTTVSFGLEDSVRAESKNDLSPIVIQIVPKTLYVSEVIAPHFNEYTLLGKEEWLEATSDLIIHIQDTREGKRTAWTIYYQLDVLKDKQQSLPQQAIQIGTGIMKGDGQALPVKEYESYALRLADSGAEMQPLVRVTDTQSNAYEYRIPKSQIKVKIPINASAGTYTATQRIILVDAPKIS